MSRISSTIGSVGMGLTGYTSPFSKAEQREFLDLQSSGRLRATGAPEPRPTVRVAKFTIPDEKAGSPVVSMYKDPSGGFAYFVDSLSGGQWYKAKPSEA